MLLQFWLLKFKYEIVKLDCNCEIGVSHFGVIFTSIFVSFEFLFLENKDAGKSICVLGIFS